MQAVRQAHRLVREAVDLGQLELVRPDPPDHHPAARGAEVDGGDEPPLGHRRKAAADAGVDGDVQAGRVGQVAADQGEDGGGDVLGQHLALEQRPLGVELAELLLGDAVDRARSAPQPLAKMPEPRTTPSGLTPLTRMPCCAELGGEQPDLVRLVGLGGAVGDVVRAGEDARSC